LLEHERSQTAKESNGSICSPSQASVVGSRDMLTIFHTLREKYIVTQTNTEGINTRQTTYMYTHYVYIFTHTHKHTLSIYLSPQPPSPAYKTSNIEKNYLIQRFNVSTARSRRTAQGLEVTQVHCCTLTTQAATTTPTSVS
jgi:hypothetical protein